MNIKKNFLKRLIKAIIQIILIIPMCLLLLLQIFESLIYGKTNVIDNLADKFIDKINLHQIWKQPK